LTVTWLIVGLIQGTKDVAWEPWSSWGVVLFVCLAIASTARSTGAGAIRSFGAVRELEGLLARSARLQVPCSAGRRHAGQVVPHGAGSAS
jgi:hypothetical protein